jgi:hypothetical protein
MSVVTDRLLFLQQRSDWIKNLSHTRVGSNDSAAPKTLGVVAGEELNKENSSNWVGSSMVEQRPFKALAAGSSPAQPIKRQPLLENFVGRPFWPPAFRLAAKIAALQFSV